jgi:cell division protein ZipA
MSDANLLRLIIAAFGALLIAALYFFGRPRKPDQGRMKPAAPRRAPAAAGGRVEPHIGDGPADLDEAGSPTIEIDGEQLELPSLRAEPPASAIDDDRAPSPSPSSTTGRRPADARFERIVTLYVAARDGGSIAGPELVVAAEKVGLEYGDMGIFHRLVENRPDLGPVFSVASMVKPGSFDMARIGELRTPGLTFFMTLPGPASALDAWDAMLPAAQRFAELLDAQVLDAEHNALGRQTIQHLRDDLRAFDRAQERAVIKPRR